MQIIIALDNMNFDKAFEHFVSLRPYVDGFKINHSLLEHTNIFEKYEGELFVDLKLWDTPYTVCSVVEKILEKGATMTSISTFNNERLFKDLLQYSEDIKFLGVTYLTSWNESEQFEITREDRINMWERHIKRIRRYGFAGIICSAHDISDIKDNSILRLCPGITFCSSNSGQTRTASPRTAKELGADYGIIGRSVTRAKHPVEVIQKINKTLILEK